jgi:hypothetical protein
MLRIHAETKSLPLVKRRIKLKILKSRTAWHRNLRSQKVARPLTRAHAGITRNQLGDIPAQTDLRSRHCPGDCSAARIIPAEIHLRIGKNPRLQQLQRRQAPPIAFRSERWVRHHRD